MSSSGRGASDILAVLSEVEQCADKALSTRQEIIDLDRRRNITREAVRALERGARQHYKGDNSKVGAGARSLWSVPSLTS